MEISSRCLFYRVSEGPCMDGHCEFNVNVSACYGKIDHCAEVNILKRYLMQRDWIKAPVDKKKPAHN